MQEVAAASVLTTAVTLEEVAKPAIGRADIVGIFPAEAPGASSSVPAAGDHRCSDDEPRATTYATAELLVTATASGGSDVECSDVEPRVTTNATAELLVTATERRGSDVECNRGSAPRRGVDVTATAATTTATTAVRIDKDIVCSTSRHGVEPGRNPGE